MAIFYQQFAQHAKTLASSTVHDTAWQFNNLVCSCGLMFDRVISTIAFRSLFSSIRLYQREQNYTCFLNQTSPLCKILDRSYRKSCT